MSSWEDSDGFYVRCGICKSKLRFSVDIHENWLDPLRGLTVEMCEKCLKRKTDLAFQQGGVDCAQRITERLSGISTKIEKLKEE